MSEAVILNVKEKCQCCSTWYYVASFATCSCGHRFSTDFARPWHEIECPKCGGALDEDRQIETRHTRTTALSDVRPVDYTELAIQILARELDVSTTTVFNSLEALGLKLYSNVSPEKLREIAEKHERYLNGE